MRAFICPQCGASLSINDEGREFAFCEYCGQKIDLADYRTVHTEHFVDEAKLKEAEAHMREVELKEAKFEEEQRSKELERIAKQKLSEKRKTRIYIFIGICIFFLPAMMTDGDAFGTFFLLLILIGVILFKTLPAYERRSELLDEGCCLLPKSIRNLENKDHARVASALRKAGFTNIQTHNLHDVKFGILTKQGQIESIQIDGQDIVSEQQIVRGAYKAVYVPDIPIVITYHGK